MTQEEKQLMLKDLCGRLLYNVKVAIDFKSYLEWLPDDDDNSEYPYKKNLSTILRCSNKSIEDISQEPHIVYSYIGSERFSMLNGYENHEYGVPIELIKPYLRPMSSMTMEEECEFCRLFECDSVNAMYGYINWVVGDSCDYDDFDIEFSKLAKIIDWLNEHHFDYRGLIEMGLALEAPEGMYNK